MSPLSQLPSIVDWLFTFFPTPFTNLLLVTSSPSLKLVLCIVLFFCVVVLIGVLRFVAWLRSRAERKAAERVARSSGEQDSGREDSGRAADGAEVAATGARARAVVVLGSGGHTKETLALLKGWSGEHWEIE